MDQKEDKPKKKRGPAPVIIPKEVSDWIKRSGTNPYINHQKRGGGLPPWNGKK